MAFTVRAHRTPWTGDIEVLIGETGFDGRTISVASPVVFTEHTEGMMLQSTFRLDATAAQEFMDNLWHCGVRPTEGTGSAGSLRATEKHLEDMRKIAFMQLEKK